MRASTNIDEIEPLLLYAGALMLGLAIGGWSYYAVTGQAYGNVPLGAQPDWFAAFTAVVTILILLKVNNRILRAAFALHLAGQAPSLWTWVGGPGAPAWLTREALQVCFAALLIWAGWHSVSVRAGQIAIAILLLAVPARYWTVKQWHEMRVPPSVMQGR
jgi:hypothetical protein